MDKKITLEITLEGKQFRAEAVLSKEAVEKITEQINRVPKQIPTNAKDATKEFTGMNQVIGQTGFLLSDMDMFFRSNDWVTNIRMGAMSVLNNFSMIGQTAVNALRQAQASGLGFVDVMRSAMSGSNLFLIALNGGLLIIQLFTRFLGDNTKELKDNTDELKKNADALKEKSRVTLNTTIIDLEKEYDRLVKLKQIEKESFDARQEMKRKSMERSGQPYTPNTFSFSQEDELVQAGKRMTQAQNQMAMLGDEENIKNRIKELEEQRGKLQDHGNSAERDFINYQLEGMREQLNVMQGKKVHQEKSLIMTEQEYQRQIKITLEGLTQAKTEHEKYEWRKKLVELEKNHSGFNNETNKSSESKNDNINIDRNDLPKDWNEKIEKGKKIIEERNKIRDEGFESKDKIDEMMKEEAKKNSENTADTFYDTVSRSLDVMKEKLDSNRHAWQRMGDMAGNMLDKIIHKSLSVEDVISTLLQMLLKFGISSLLPGAAAAEEIPGDVLSFFNGASIEGPMSRLNRITSTNVSKSLIVLQLDPIEIRGRGRDLYGSTQKEQKIIKKYFK